MVQCKGYFEAIPKAVATMPEESAIKAPSGLPKSLLPLFHNYEVDTIVPERDAAFIILTVLAAGRWQQIKDLFALYGWERIAATVQDDLAGLRTLPDVVANFWSVVFWERPLTQRSLLEKWSPTRIVLRKEDE